MVRKVFAQISHGIVLGGSETTKEKMLIFFNVETPF